MGNTNSVNLIVLKLYEHQTPYPVCVVDIEERDIIICISSGMFMSPNPFIEFMAFSHRNLDYITRLQVILKARQY